MGRACQKTLAEGYIALSFAAADRAGNRTAE